MTTIAMMTRREVAVWGAAGIIVAAGLVPT
ncbi:hypothetical protein KIPE111705_05075 [Kibdelosporangium persicum]